MESNLAYWPIMHQSFGLTPRGRVLLGILGLATWILLYQHLADLAAWLTYGACGLAAGSHLGRAVEFFCFEVPKVLLLLVLVVFVVGMIRSFFTPERTRAILAGRRESVGNVLASLLGVVTPFCSWACRCIRTRPASSRWSRPCSARARRWASSSPS